MRIRSALSRIKCQPLEMSNNVADAPTVNSFQTSKKKAV